MAAGTYFREETGVYLVTFKGFAIALGLSLLLCWPMLLATAPLVYFDTLAYRDTGGRVIALLLDMLAPAADTGAGGNSEAREEAASVTRLRSVAYSSFLYLTSQPFGTGADAMQGAGLVAGAALALQQVAIGLKIFQDPVQPVGRDAVVPRDA